jgi:hypothetical protein
LKLPFSVCELPRDNAYPSSLRVAHAG